MQIYCYSVHQKCSNQMFCSENITYITRPTFYFPYAALYFSIRSMNSLLFVLQLRAPWSSICWDVLRLAGCLPANGNLSETAQCFSHFDRFLIGNTMKACVTIITSIHESEWMSGSQYWLIIWFLQINEDLEGEVRFTSTEGLFFVPIRCTTKKCDVSHSSKQHCLFLHLYTYIWWYSIGSVLCIHPGFSPNLKVQIVQFLMYVKLCPRPGSSSPLMTACVNVSSLQLEVDSQLIDFGLQVVGQTISRTVTLTNKGALATHFSLDTSTQLRPEMSRAQMPSRASASTRQVRIPGCRSLLLISFFTAVALLQLISLQQQIIEDRIKMVICRVRYCLLTGDKQRKHNIWRAEELCQREHRRAAAKADESGAEWGAAGRATT